MNIKYYGGGIRILEIPKWGMVPNRLGTTGLISYPGHPFVFWLVGEVLLLCMGCSRPILCPTDNARFYNSKISDC